MFRAAHPRDIAGLLRFAAQAAPNLAHPAHHLGTDRGRVWVSRAAVSTWLPRRGRTVQPLLLAKGRELRGLVVLRGLRDMATWEVDQLLVGAEAPHTCAELLARADVSLVRAKAERVFLRLADEDTAIGPANEAGYRRYKEESVFRTSSARPLGETVLLPSGVTAHPKRPEDEYRMFRLSTASSPVQVRAAEGLTFREWQEAVAVRSQGTRKVRDIVFEAESHLVGWLRTGFGTSKQVLAEAVVHPDRRGDLIEPIVHTALAYARGKSLAIVVASDDEPMAGAVESAGLRYCGRYTSLVHQIRVKVTESAFMPAPVS